VSKWRVEAEKNEARFKTLQGKYNAEVPALHQQIRALTAEVDQLKAKLEQAAAVPQPQPSAHLFDDNARQELIGVDRAQAIENAIQEGVKRQLASLGLDTLAAKVQPIIEAAPAQQQSAAMAHTQAVRTQVSTGMPYFEAVDSDPRFEAWLQDADELSGKPRMVFFQEAFQGGDIARLKAFYNTFARANGFADGAPKPPVDPGVPLSPVAPGGGAPSPSASELVSLAEYSRVSAELTKARSNPGNYPRGHADELAMRVAAWDKLIAAGKFIVDR
jgi:hypothetical protein